ncbi:MAG: nucleoside deaminase [Bacteroidales bacterium]|nr:nucleoside deaminase [Bacteroidales bacterium]
MNQSEKFMKEAIDLSIDNIDRGGGPFGAVIVKDGKIVAAAANSVTNDNDPTAHAEVNAIRKASKILNTFNLSDCEIYTSCEPCPMCLGAIYWSGIKTVYYGNTKKDAAKIEFDDQFIYDELDKPIHDRHVKFIPLMRSEAQKAFVKWASTENKTEY